MKSSLHPRIAIGAAALVVALVIAVSALTARTASADIGACPAFPANNIWNAPIDDLPVDAHSADYIQMIGPNIPLHPDFGSKTWDGGPIGIPYDTVPGTQPLVAIHYTDYGDESDPGPFPIPPDAPVEWGSDHHVLVIDRDHCMLYELYNASINSDGIWNASSGAKYDLLSNALRPDTWTSADAADLPMFPGLVRYDEVQAGAITHALRFTAPDTQKKHIWPARHDASDNSDPRYPPMGQRFRLKASFDISGYPPQARIVLQALKTYGMILADNGASWYIGGAPNENWDDDQLVQSFKLVHGSDFQAVDESSLMLDPNSGEVKPWQHLWLPLIMR